MENAAGQSDKSAKSQQGEDQKRRRSEKRRVRRKKIPAKCQKLRNGGLKGRLGKAGGAEGSGDRMGQNVHNAVAREGSGSQSHQK